LTELGDGPTTAGWNWVTEEYEFAGLIFVREATPERLIEVFGADPAAALRLTAKATYEAFGYPWVRVGQAGEWAFAINDSLDLEGPALELSAGTEVARFEMGPSLDYFYFYVDGVEVTSFEPLMAYDRGGTDPDRFIASMSQAGLPVNRRPDADDDRAYGLGWDPSLALLNMLTLALGIQVPREVGLGQLLAFQPDEPEPRR
jgi:hypothetical protein